jgi:hypothetical protein
VHPTVPRHSDDADHRPQPRAESDQPVGNLNDGSVQLLRTPSDVQHTPAQSAADSAQVQATYQDMYNATTAGNRAPLILGNHFNDWNNNAYTTALGGFLLANCGKPDTYCVPFRDVVAWMKLQDPTVLAALQNQAPALGPRSN